MSVNQPLHQHQFADLESIPNLLGHAILNANDGSQIQSPSGSMSTHDIDLMYQILLEVGEIMKGDMNMITNRGIGSSDKFKKITIEGRGVSYSVCLTTEGYIYIVKRRSVDNGDH